jgi:hypothetical protein
MVAHNAASLNSMGCTRFMNAINSLYMRTSRMRKASVHLQEEGIKTHLTLTDPERAPSSAILLSTLVCFVLIHSETRSHTFCSAYDFGPWPLLSSFSPNELHTGLLDALASTRAIMLNGCIFDELSYEVVGSIAQRARGHGAAVFFDPGASLSIKS